MPAADDSDMTPAGLDDASPASAPMSFLGGALVGGVVGLAGGVLLARRRRGPARRIAARAEPHARSEPFGAGAWRDRDRGGGARRLRRGAGAQRPHRSHEHATEAAATTTAPPNGSNTATDHHDARVDVDDDHDRCSRGAPSRSRTSWSQAKDTAVATLGERRPQGDGRDAFAGQRARRLRHLAEPAARARW